MSAPVTDESDRIVRLSRLAAQLTDAWNSRNPERVAALCAPDYEGENVGEATPHRGLRGDGRVGCDLFCQRHPAKAG
jgi:hypothetical protein